MAQPVANNTLLRPAVTNGKVTAATEVHVQENPCNLDSTPQGAGAVEDDREPSYLLQGLLSCISALEGADTVLLGACMGALQHDIGIEITDIGYMTVSQAVATNLAAPFWGILADRGILQRRTVLLLGSMGQGLVTILLAFVTDMIPMILLRALNGVLLAALRPISNGIVADVTAEKHRGKIFGRVQSALLMGMFVTTMTVVPMAPEKILGFQGWRVAFVLVGMISVIVSGLVTFFMVEPPRDEAAAQASQSEERGCQAVVAEVKSLLQFFRKPTFCIMIRQGIFGTIPWSVMGYMTLFFQLSGIENGRVAILSGIGPIAGAFGNLIGGLVADGLATRFGLHGRPLSAQLTVDPSDLLHLHGCGAGSRQLRRVPGAEPRLRAAGLLGTVGHELSDPLAHRARQRPQQGHGLGVRLGELHRQCSGAHSCGELGRGLRLQVRAARRQEHEPCFRGGAGKSHGCNDLHPLDYLLFGVLASALELPQGCEAFGAAGAARCSGTC
mmetsp:Transcript_80002/g.259332  ORF Transcript_80002/g.259332 Transcript_80002/m.259332 type:complete len:500 (+) Transcript_80002:84-1583(+)